MAKTSVGAMMKRSSWLILVVLLIAGCGTTQPQATAPALASLPPNIAGQSKLLDTGGRGTVATNDPAPDFEFTTSDGKITKLSDLRGKTIIVNFWATWCGPCRQEMPDLQKFADSSKGMVVVLAVNKLEEASVIAPYAKEVGVQFTLIANPSGEIPERYGIRNLPTSYFVRPDGTIGDWRLGAMDTQMIQQSIEKSR
jgi:thiol-disulfide isomerase/thioredoxin